MLPFSLDKDIINAHGHARGLICRIASSPGSVSAGAGLVLSEPMKRSSLLRQVDFEENVTPYRPVSHISSGLIIAGQGRSGILPAVLHPLSAVDGSRVINLVPFPAIDDIVKKAMLKSEAGRNKKRKQVFFRICSQIY